METDVDYQVKIEDGTSVWFSFETSEAGEYRFASSGNADTVGNLYNGNEQQLVMNDDENAEGTGYNFGFAYQIEAGQKYYLEVGLVEAQSGEFTVFVEKVEEESVESELTELEMAAEAEAEPEEPEPEPEMVYLMEGLSLISDEEDGIEAQADENSGSSMETAVEITEGDSFTVTPEMAEYNYYVKFTPEVDGAYLLRAPEEFSFSAVWIDSEGNWLTSWSAAAEQELCSYKELTAGETYFVMIWSLTSDITFTLERAVNLNLGEEYSFKPGEDLQYLFFTPSETGVYSIKYQGEYSLKYVSFIDVKGNRWIGFNDAICSEPDGYETSSGVLIAGHVYRIVNKYSDILQETGSIQIKKHEIEPQELHVNGQGEQNTIIIQDSENYTTYASFTPAESGYYSFYFQAPEDSYMRAYFLYDAIDVESEMKMGFREYLEAGVTYFLEFYGGNEGEAVYCQVFRSEEESIELVEEPEKTVFTSGIDQNLDLSGIIVQINYTDGYTEILKDGEGINAEYFGEMLETPYPGWEIWTPGISQVKVWKENPDTVYMAYDIIVHSVSDIATQVTMSEDFEVTVTSEENYYAFTPEETGTYLLNLTAENGGSIYINRYEDYGIRKNGWSLEDGQMLSVDLEANESFLFGMRVDDSESYDVTLNISQKEEFSLENAKETTLNLYSGENHISFTAPKSGMYYLNVQTEAVFSIEVRKDGEGVYWSNVFAGHAGYAEYIPDLEAGVTYDIVIYNYNSEVRTAFTMKMQPEISITGIAAELENAKTEFISGLDQEVEEFYVTLTFSDGSQGTCGLYNSYAGLNWRYSGDLNADDTWKAGSQSITIYKADVECVVPITVKAIEELDGELDENLSGTFESQDGTVQFWTVIPEGGLYEISAQIKSEQTGKNYELKVSGAGSFYLYSKWTSEIQSEKVFADGQKLLLTMSDLEEGDTVSVKLTKTTTQLLEENVLSNEFEISNDRKTWFRLKPSIGGYYKWRMVNSGANYTSAELYNSSGDNLFNMGCNTGSEEEYELWLGNDQEYFIAVYADDSSSTVQMQFTSPVGNAQLVEVGKSFDMTLESNGQFTYVKFVPDASGVYEVISDQVSWGELWGSFFSAGLEGICERRSSEDGVLKVSQYLYEGETYYFGIRSWDLDETKTVSCIIQSAEGKKIREVSQVGELSYPDCANLAEVASLNFQISYEDGDSSSFKWDGRQYTSVDEYGNVFVLKTIRSTSDETEYTLDSEKNAPAGTYELVFELSGTEITVNAQKIASEELPTLTENENHSIISQGAEGVYYRFIPQSTGYYNVAADGETTYGYFYSNGGREYFENGWKLSVTAGNTYVVQIATSDNYLGEEISFGLYSSKTPQELTVITGTTKFQDEAYTEPLKDWQFIFRYEDGDGETIGWKETDSYWNSVTNLTLVIRNADGEECTWGSAGDGFWFRYGTGTYTLEFYLGDQKLAEEEIQIVSMEDLAETITLGECVVPAGTTAYYSFTPEIGVLYEAYCDQTDMEIRIYSGENRDRVEGANVLYTSSGKTYYLECENSSQEAQTLNVIELPILKQVGDEISKEELLALPETSRGLRYLGIMCEESGTYLLESLESLEDYTGINYFEWFHEEFSCWYDTDASESWADGKAAFSIQLEAGKCYIAEIRSVQSGWKLEKAPSVQSMTIQEPDMTVYPAGYHPFIDWGLKATLTYDNGETTEVTLEEGDKYGNGLMLDTQGMNDTQWQAGETYTVYVYASNDSEVRQSFTVEVVAAPEGTKALAVGSNEIAKGEKWQIYSFTAPETGTYQFESDSDIYTKWYYMDTDEYGDFWDVNDKYLWKEQITLQAGETVVFSVRGSSYSRELNISLIPEMSGFEIADVGRTQYIQGLETVNLRDFELEVSYTDGTSQIVTYTDSYGNYFRSSLVNADGEEVDADSELPAGTYKVTVTCGEFSADYPIQVLTLEEAAAGNTLTLDQTLSVEGNKEVSCLTFVPDETATYEISFNTRLKVRVFEKQGEQMEEITGRSGNYCLYLNLNESQTYYFMITPYSGRDTYRITIKKVSAVEKIALSNDKEYIAGVDTYRNNDIQVDITYSDETENSIRGEESDVYGNWFRFDLSKDGEAVESMSLRSGSAIMLAAGTYQAAAYLNGAEPKMGTVEFEVKALDVASLPVISTDQTVTCESGRQLFQFTPQESGTYNITTTGAEDAYFMYQYQEDGCWYRSYGSLNASETYLLIVEGSASGIVAISKRNSGGSTEPEGGELTLGETVQITCEGDYVRVIYTFTPEHTGTYTFTSSENTADWYVKCYGDEEWIADQEGGAGETIRLRDELQAGVEYTYSVSIYGEGGCQVVLNEYQKRVPESITIQEGKCYYAPIEGLFSQELILMNYCLQITYTNGETESNVLWGEIGSDSDGNIFNVSLSENPIRETDTEKIYQIDVSCGELTASAEMSVLKQESIESLAVGQEKTLTLSGEGTEYFCFTAETNGEYFLGGESESENGTYSIRALLDRYEDYGLYENFTTQKGKTYFIRVSWSDYEEAGNVTFHVGEKYTVTGLEITKEPNDSYAFYGMVEPDLNGMEVTVTYSNQTTETLSSPFGDVGDQHGNGIYESAEFVNKSTYRISVTCGGYYAALDIPAVQKEELPKVTTSEKITIAFGDEESTRVFAFTPETSGTYTISDQDGSSIGSILYDENYKSVSQQTAPVYILEAGKTYYGTVSGSGTVELMAAAGAERNLLDTTITLLGAENLVYTGSPLEPTITVVDGENVLTEGTDYELLYENNTDAGNASVTVTGKGDYYGTETIPFTINPASMESVTLSAIPTQNYTGSALTPKPELTFNGRSLTDSEFTCTYADNIQGNASGAATITITGQNNFTGTITGTFQIHQHDWQTVSETAATCTTEGKIVQKCSCGEEQTQTIKALGHSYSTDWKIDKAATCTTEGSKSHHCTRCDAKTDVTTIAATGHTWDAGKVTKAATCGAAGVKTYTCATCGGTKTESIAATGQHTYKVVVDKAATCTTAGSQHEECSVCGNKKAAMTIAATGHTWDAGKVTKAATCGAAGVKTYTCATCGGTKTESIAATGQHTYKVVVDKAATCTTAGSQHEECSVCGNKKAAMTIAATGHTWDAGKVTKAATCGAAGVKTYTCATCGETKTETIAATGKHTYQVVVDKAATCGEAGSQHEECSVCGDKKAATTIAATGKHTYQVVVDKAATCGEAGSQHEECSVCGDKKAATAIPATGEHSFGEYKVTTEATVLKTGTQTRTCSVCKATETKKIAKLTATIKVAKTSVTVTAGKSITAPKVTFAKGDSIKSWKSNKTSVATVSSKGKITGKKAGTATITVTLKSGKTAKIKVTVKKIATTKLKVNKTSVTLKKGKTLQLKVTVTPKNSQDKLTFKSSNKKVATVSSKGKITAKKKGTATITIVSGKKKVTCKVKVK
ncbi:MAG: Ig-like domain-containing protein [Eubacteriales bacterium]|nr:Ig-like domain-containing protein [Eubacteriales bacterium]